MPRNKKKKDNKKAIKIYNFYIRKSIIMDILMILIGLLFIKNPYSGIRICEISFAILLILNGLISVFEGSTNKIVPIFKLNVIYGVISTAIGALIIINPLSLTRILTIMFGIWMLISGIIKLFYGSYLKASEDDSWMITLTTGILTVLFSLLVIFYEFASMSIIQVAAIFLVLYSLLDLVNNFLYKKRSNEIIDIFNK